MKLIDNPTRVMLIAYSFWAQVLGVVVYLVPEIIYITTGRDINPRFLWWTGLGLLLFGLVGRVIRQSGSAARNLVQIAAVALVILLVSFVAANARPSRPVQPAQHVSAPTANDAQAIARALERIAKWEGKRNSAYIPIQGDVPTICYGSTRGVRMGDYMTDAECLDLLRREVVEYRSGIRAWFVPDTIRYRLPPLRDAVWTGFAYNVGVPAAGKSTATRRLNAGDVSGACEALGWWNKAGQRVIRGLVNRRAEDVRDCMVGVA